MSDFLGRLAQRVVAPRALLQPRLPSLFEAPAAAEPMREETDGPVAVPNAAVSTPTVAPARQAASIAAGDTEIGPRKTNDRPQPAGERVETTARPVPEPRREYERQEQLVVVREVLEAIPAEIAANGDLASPSNTVAPEPGLTPAQSTAPRPRVIMRRAAESRRPAISDTPAAVPAQGERDVRITIGRIDVRAVTPPPRERPAPKASRTLTLDDYLSQRGRR